MNSNSKRSARRRGSFPQWLIKILVGAFIVAAFLSAYLFFDVVYNLAAAWTGTGLPEFNISGGQTGDGTLSPDVTPTVVLLDELPESWSGTSRVTILFMGLDYRDWVKGESATRTDTMILVTLDPVSETAGVLSIPRDLWVEIPAYGHGRINNAYYLGEVDRLPGGGPALAVKTVEKFIGVPIQYYIQVDFGAFVRMVDEIGGVEINIPEEIRVDPIAHIAETNTVVLEPGTQTLGGELTLAYARARNTEGGDFDRAQRQQQVALAIRDQMLKLDMIPILIAKAPSLYQELASGIRTDMSLDQMISLGLSAIKISPRNIRRGVIAPPDMVTMETVNYGGDVAEVLKPVPSQIRLLRDEIFTATGAIGPSIAVENTTAAAKQENARVAVLNGDGALNLATDMGELLLQLGLNVVETDNADSWTYPTTLVKDFTGNPYTTHYLMDLLDLSQSQILFQSIPDSEIDVAIIFGFDWRNLKPKLLEEQD